MERRARVCLVAGGILLALLLVIAFALWSLPTTAMSLDVGADGSALFGARNAALTLGTHRLRWPDDSSAVEDILLQYLRRCRRDESGLPLCVLEARFDPAVRASSLMEAVIAARRLYMARMALGSDDVRADVSLMRNEGWNSIPAFGKPRSLTLMWVGPPARGVGPWRRTIVELENAIPIPEAWELHAREARRQAAAGVGWQAIEDQLLLRRDQIERSVPVDVGGSTLDCMSLEEWNAVSARAVKESQVESDMAWDIDTSAVDAVCIATDNRALAWDVVRLLSALYDRAEPAKACLVGDTSRLP